MKNKSKLSLLILAAGILVSCGGTTSSASETIDNSSSQEEVEYSLPDKSGLKYVSSLDKYKKTDWEAKWIWDEKTIQNSYVALRKTFNISSVPTSAKASISSVTKYHLWINGELVVYDGCAKHGPTPVDSFYDEVELASYLKAGENTIVALVSYAGRSSNSYIDCGTAGFLFELDADNTKVVSDSTWKVKRLKEYRNKSLLKDDWPDHKQASFLGEWDVYYDAREATIDYEKPTFNDSDWANAVVVGKPGYLPFGDLYKNQMPVFKFGKEYIDCVDVDNVIGKKLSEAKTVKFRMDGNRQYYPYFEIDAPAGAHLTYYSDTYWTDDGTAANFMDDYVAKEGLQSFESMAWRTGQNIIIDVPAGVTIKRVAYRTTGIAAEKAGKFVSSNEKMNQLWREAQNTLDICTRDTYMDCPDRERSPYAGDSANQFAFSYYLMDKGVNELTKKTLRTLPGWVEKSENGVYPTRWPSNTINEIPIQNLAFLSTLHNYYLYTGDVESLELVYPIAIDYLKVWNMKDGLPEYRDGSFKWIDWGTNPDGQVLQREFYYQSLNEVKKLAADLGKSEDNQFLDERITSIKNNFDKAYWKTNGYSSSGNLYDERAQAMAVIAGLASEDKKDTILPILHDTKTCSTYMERYILEALCALGDFEGATNRALDRYKPMLEDEFTTLWENWTTAGSMNHAWTGGPSLAMSKWIAGIIPTGKDYSSYELYPHSTLGDLETYTDTNKGGIAMKVATSDGKTTITLDTIEADGTLKIGTEYGTNINVKSGTSELKSSNDEYKAYSLNKGHYVFEITK